MRPSRLRNLKWSALAAIGLAASSTVLGGPPRQSPTAGQAAPAWQARSVWDGAYSEEQAKRGEPMYRRYCASCHGGMLTGGESASPLTGSTFTSNSNGLAIDDLFERIRRSMPQDRPGRLSRQQNADILAYVLSVNKFPAGKTELPVQSEYLKQIRFEAMRPDARGK